MQSSIRLITLDLDDTLWPCMPVIRAAEQALYDWMAKQTPRITQVYDPPAIQAHRGQIRERNPQMAHDVTALRREALADLMREQGYPEPLADEGMRVFRDRRNQVEPYEDVRPVLLALRERYTLIAITNGNAEVEQTPLRGCFHHRLTAGEVGAEKPHPALFEHAMAWAEATPEQTLHLGDDPHRDVDAARRLGLNAVWIDRYGRDWPEELDAPAHRHQDLHQFHDWLNGMAVDAATVNETIFN